jgi:hypothetical protein
LQSDKGRIKKDWYNPKEFIATNLPNELNNKSNRCKNRSLDYRNVRRDGVVEDGDKKPDGGGIGASLKEYFKSTFINVAK